MFWRPLCAKMHRFRPWRLMFWALLSNKVLPIPCRYAAISSLSLGLVESYSPQSFPVIVALETSPVSGISNRASALHAVLQGKHSSLLNTRYTISARKSFDYQKKISAGVVQGILLSMFYYDFSSFRMYRIPYATNSNCSTSTVVFPCSREETDQTRLLEVACEDFPGKSFVWIIPSQSFLVIPPPLSNF